MNRRDSDSASTYRRRFPRVALCVKARLSAASAKGASQFEATLSTTNVSVGGVFFESTYFLKIGQSLHVEFALPGTAKKVCAKGHVVRIESRDEGGRSKSGFAVRFDEYLESSDLVLAQYFLEPQLRGFMKEYTHRQGLKLSREQMDFVVDALAAWELEKADAVANPWSDHG